MNNKHNLYIISGCNGAGKTTASYTILPELLDCREFVNADEIAKGLSPFQPEKVAIDAGRIMLARIDELLSRKEDFAFETTLATKSYVQTIKRAKEAGYQVTLVYFWLESVELALERVQTRVKEGGHNIPEDVIRRRYVAGIRNLFQLYLDNSDMCIIINNTQNNPVLVARKEKNILTLYKQSDWERLQQIAYANNK